MIKHIFKLVADCLMAMASKCGITYNEINIIVYYLLIPLSWTILLDYYLSMAWISCTLLLVWLGIIIGSWGRFSRWCDDAFKWSVGVLKYFNRWGSNYVLNSVIICVFVPILIYIGLIILLTIH